VYGAKLSEGGTRQKRYVFAGHGGGKQCHIPRVWENGSWERSLFVVLESHNGPTVPNVPNPILIFAASDTEVTENVPPNKDVPKPPEVARNDTCLTDPHTVDTQHKP
jgi:hypothetical protein